MEFSAAKSVGNSKNIYACQWRIGAILQSLLLILPSCQANSFLQARKCMFLSLCVFVYVRVYLCMSSCMYMCMYIYACECVCALAVLWLLLRCVCYLFPSRHPISHPGAANGNVSFFLFFFLAEVRNRTLASMWFELGPLKLWRTPRMTWGTCRPNSILLNGGEKSSSESSEIFWLGPASD